MRKRLTILMFILISYSSSYAQEKGLGDSPQPVSEKILEQMELRVVQGICQKEWVDNQSLAQVFSISQNQEIVAFPCSMWSYNQAWSMFLKVRGGNNTHLIKPLFFIRYSSYKGLYADSVVENISWDKKAKILTSKKYLNGRTSCGELAGYQWSEENQDFQTLSIYKNNCKQRDSDWEQVF